MTTETFFRDDVHQIAKMLTRIANKYLAEEETGNMAGVNVYTGGGCGGALLTSELLHQTVDLALRQDVGITEDFIIQGVAGKRIAILGGRLGSKANCTLFLYDGSSEGWMMDSTDLPETPFVLVSVPETMPHYLTGVGQGLYFYVKVLEANPNPADERYIRGFLKYILVDA
jgi:hypothetical protein